MTKRIAYDFLGLYGAILKDISVYFPDDQRWWDRDFAILTRLTSTRGQSVFTIDLPAIGKVLDRALADGRLIFANQNFIRSGKRGSKIPKLFRGLWMRLFDDYGCLNSNIDPNTVLFLRTLLYVGKNLEWECAPRYLFEATKEFYDVENLIPKASPEWDIAWGFTDEGSTGHLRDRFPLSGDGSLCFDDESYTESDKGLLDSIQQSADRVIGIIGDYNPDEHRFKHGPGAVSDARKGNWKYRFPNWPPRLEEMFPKDRYGLSGLGLMESIGHDGLDGVSTEPLSKLIAVPKTQKGPRLIASEPTAHQWCQQSMASFIHERVRHTYLSRSLTFESQKPSQIMALFGSLNGRFATLDLKSASDRLSCWLVQRIFRKNRSLLRCMASSRTRFISNEIDSKQPKLHKLRKFSTQGSALTFPVQSLVFTIICLGVGRYLHPDMAIQELCRRVRVFGDDIIVPREWEPSVVRSLELLYLKVNQAKSFAAGKFRESCGMDAWEGHDVTPPHITMRAEESNPRTIASSVAVSNNFFKKGFWHAADWVRTTVNCKGKLPTIGRSSGAFGFITNCKGLEYTNTRWNPHLQRTELRCLVVLAKSLRLKQDGSEGLLQFFTEEPVPYIKYESGIPVAGVPVIRHQWVPTLDLAG
jgi:hypothetical protein